jgi:transposase-like protein
VGLKLGGCPDCHGAQVVKRGKTDTGKQRSRCHTPKCAHESFLLDWADKGRAPEIKPQVMELRLNGSGSRATARVLQSSTATGMGELKKKALSSRRSIRPS